MEKNCNTLYWQLNIIVVSWREVSGNSVCQHVNMIMYVFLLTSLSLLFVCQAFGWCSNGSKCPLSHDTDLIILQDEKCKEDKRSRRKRKRERKRAGGNVAGGSSTFDVEPENKVPHMDTDETPEHQQGVTEEQIAESGLVEGNPADVQLVDSDGGSKQKEEEVKPDEEENGVCEDSKTSAKTDTEKPKLETGTHRAGFDAFMTGYIFAHAQAFIKKGEGGGAVEKEPQEEEQWLPTCLNKIYLSGKSVPLHVVKSTFAKSSKAHVQKMEMMWGASV